MTSRETSIFFKKSEASHWNGHEETWARRYIYHIGPSQTGDRHRLLEVLELLCLILSMGKVKVIEVAVFSLNPRFPAVPPLFIPAHTHTFLWRSHQHHFLSSSVASWSSRKLFPQTRLTSPHPSILWQSCPWKKKTPVKLINCMDLGIPSVDTNVTMTHRFFLTVEYIYVWWWCFSRERPTQATL